MRTEYQSRSFKRDVATMHQNREAHDRRPRITTKEAASSLKVDAKALCGFIAVVTRHGHPPPQSEKVARSRMTGGKQKRTCDSYYIAEEFRAWWKSLPKEWRDDFLQKNSSPIPTAGVP